jgi:hypothetical protein
MSRMALRLGLIASGGFVLASLFELIPILGISGGILELGAWIGLAAWFVHSQKTELATLESPPLGSLGWGALIGALTGITGAMVSLLASIVLAIVAAAALSAGSSGGTASPAPAASWNALASGISVVGSMLGLVYWPVLGALVCGLSALLFAAMMVKRPQPAGRIYSPLPPPTPGGAQLGSVAPPPPGASISPDGRYYWNGSYWVPIEPGH